MNDFIFSDPPLHSLTHTHAHASPLLWQGVFDDTLNETGWGILDIKTSAAASDTQQHFAAGILEGALTATELYPTYVNNNAFTFKGKDTPTLVVQWMAAQDKWTRSMIASADPTDTFWTHVAAVVAQFDGLVEGYAHAVKEGTVQPIPLFGFQMLNAIGDLFQIIPVSGTSGWLL